VLAVVVSAGACGSQLGAWRNDPLALWQQR